MDEAQELGRKYLIDRLKGLENYDLFDAAEWLDTVGDSDYKVIPEWAHADGPEFTAFKYGYDDAYRTVRGNW